MTVGMIEIIEILEIITTTDNYSSKVWIALPK